MDDASGCTIVMSRISKWRLRADARGAINRLLSMTSESRGEAGGSSAVHFFSCSSINHGRNIGYARLFNSASRNETGAICRWNRLP